MAKLIRHLSAVALAITSLSAAATDFTFAQGSMVTGTFSATDVDNNGYFDKSELTGFSLLVTQFSAPNWMGTSTFYPGFSQGLAQLQHFTLKTDLTSIALFSHSAYNDFSTRDGSQSFMTFGSPVGYSLNEKMTITAVAAPTAPVPEPETYAMMLAGLGVLGAMARRKRA